MLYHRIKISLIVFYGAAHLKSRERPNFEPPRKAPQKIQHTPCFKSVTASPCNSLGRHKDSVRESAPLPTKYQESNQNLINIYSSMRLFN